MIKNVAASFEGTCTQKKISIELLFASKQMEVFADKRKIQQVLYNLLDNAIKFSDPESTVTIETTERGEKVSISVKDYGIGIPRSALGKIWERFYKTDLSGQRQKRNGPGACHCKGSHPGPRRKYQRGQHRGRGHRIYLHPPPGTDYSLNVFISSRKFRINPTDRSRASCPSSALESLGSSGPNQPLGAISLVSLASFTVPPWNFTAWI